MGWLVTCGHVGLLKCSQRKHVKIESDRELWFTAVWLRYITNLWGESEE